MFSPLKYQCPACEDIIFSTFSGEFVMCKCKQCFVDQTEGYLRTGGAPVLVTDKGQYAGQDEE